MLSVIDGSPGLSSSAFWISAGLGQADLAFGERVAERVVGVLMIGLERSRGAAGAHLVDAIELLVDIACS
jgi:hypothetical protein